MGKPVVHFEVLGKDGDKLQQFYGDLFEWKINADNPMNYGLVDTQSEEGISGGVGENPEGAGVTFFVQVEDLQDSLDKVERLGGRTIMPPTDLGMVELAFFRRSRGQSYRVDQGLGASTEDTGSAAGLRPTFLQWSAQHLSTSMAARSL